MRIGRVLRGIVKTAVTWSVVWVPLSLIPFTAASLFGGAFSTRILSAMVISQALAGFINGGVFATVLAIAGRRKTFESLSLPWIAACGAIGAVVFPVGVRTVLLSTLGVHLPISAFMFVMVTNAALGAGLAAASLSVARRAPVLPDGGDGDITSIGSGDAAPETATRHRAIPNVQPSVIADPSLA